MHLPKLSTYALLMFRMFVKVTFTDIFMISYLLSFLYAFAVLKS